MYKSNKVIVVLPAYNASKTLKNTIEEIPDLVDEIILCDDHSSDDTLSIAKMLNIKHILSHDRNKGYGANQKTLYDHALSLGGDIIIMVHPDYQYTPKLITAMVSIIGENIYPVVLGSRILGNGARRGGMPIYKYYANRILTLIQNALSDHKLSEYHTGYRAFQREVLESINYCDNSDDFIFDNQLLSQIIMSRYSIGEITCPTKYMEESSSINFRRSVTYGVGVLMVSIQHAIHRLGVYRFRMYYHLKDKRQTP